MPKDMETSESDKDDERAVGCWSDVAVLYLHGVSGNRGKFKRVESYKMLLDIGCTVLAIDYRGFGDSSQEVSLCETSVVEDSLAAMQWLHTWGKKRILVWGHSMGGAIACQVLTRWKQPLLGLVLDSTFDKLATVVHRLLESKGNGLQKLLSPLMPISLLLKLSDLVFASDSVIVGIDAPILQLHAEDDRVIPLDLAMNLYNTAVDAGKTNIKLEVFKADRGLGHGKIYSAKELPTILNAFFCKQ